MTLNLRETIKRRIELKNQLIYLVCKEIAALEKELAEIPPEEEENPGVTKETEEGKRAHVA